MKTSHDSNMRLLVVVFFAVLTGLASAPHAFAQILIGAGEGSYWTKENVDGGLTLQSTYSEARNAGNLLSVWRGATNNQVWMSLNNGKPFTIGGTVTYVSPNVVAFGSDSFMVFHTGDTGNIFYTQVFGDGSNSGSWNAVPNNSTNLTVSVAQMGTNSNQLYMVYRGLGNDLRVWGLWYNGQTNVWSAPSNINGGMANTAPGVAMNYYTNQLFITAQGTDNSIWMTHQKVGASSWTSWVSTGQYTQYTPYSAACANGNMVVDSINALGNPAFAKFDGNGNQQSSWALLDMYPSPGVTSPVQLTANGNQIFALANVAGDGDYRLMYNCN